MGGGGLGLTGKVAEGGGCLGVGWETSIVSLPEWGEVWLLAG